MFPRTASGKSIRKKQKFRRVRQGYTRPVSDLERSPSPRARSETTITLGLAAGGDPAAQERLLSMVHDDLKRVAREMLRRERPGHTLQPTALLNEAWLRLIRQDPEQLSNKEHFLATAARAMRRVLVDHARRRMTRVQGGKRVELSDDHLAGTTGFESVDLRWIPDLDAALAKLESLDPRKGQVVELHVFGGLSLDEVAAALGVSAPTVDRDWAFARAWLKVQLTR
jgi:RNA polymerase sigma-70 factor, ECF subfamily